MGRMSEFSAVSLGFVSLRLAAAVINVAQPFRRRDPAFILSRIGGCRSGVPRDLDARNYSGMLGLN